MNYIDNYFDNLSDDLKNMILSMRDNYSVNKIINVWRRYIGKKIIASQLLIKNVMHVPYIIPFINIFNNRTAKILEYCNKVLTGYENDWWIKQFRIIENFTIEYNYYAIGNDSEYFNRIAIALDKLKLKFNW